MFQRFPDGVVEIAFCPGRDYITLNFSMEGRHIANVDKIMPLLERIEAMDIPASSRIVEEDANG